MRKFALLLLWLTLLGSGGYVFVYLYRWEWQRAQVALGFFLAAELAVAATLLLAKLSRADDRPQAGGPARDRLRARVHDAPPEGTPFRWLGPPPDRASVFIPVLLGAGVVAAGIAWVVERVAAATARTGVENDLAEDLAGVDFPDRLVPDDEALLVSGGAVSDPALRRLLRPGGGR